VHRIAGPELSAETATLDPIRTGEVQVSSGYRYDRTHTYTRARSFRLIFLSHLMFCVCVCRSVVVGLLLICMSFLLGYFSLLL